MARKRQAAQQQHSDQEDHHPTPEGPVSTAAAVADAPESMGDAVEQSFQQNNGAETGPRKFTPAPDPFAIATINAPDNQLHLGKSARQRAFMIRFNENPNEGRAKDDPHPVLALLKDAGYKFRPVNDGGMAWVKPWSGPDYSYRDELDAREIAKQAAEAMGAPAQDRGAAR